MIKSAKSVRVIADYCQERESSVSRAEAKFFNRDLLKF
jgi:hypothetical protein